MAGSDHQDEWGKVKFSSAALTDFAEIDRLAGESEEQNHKSNQNDRKKKINEKRVPSKVAPLVAALNDAEEARMI